MSITSLGAKRRYWITKDGLNKAKDKFMVRHITIISLILSILTPFVERNINYGIEGAAFNPASTLKVIAEESVNVMARSRVYWYYILTFSGVGIYKLI